MINKVLIKNLIDKYPLLSSCKKDIENTCNLLITLYKNKNKLLICGNGGSSADADHMVSELMKGFIKPRPINNDIANKIKSISNNDEALLTTKLENGLPAISLSVHSALISAISNDNGGDFVFAQQVLGYGNTEDVLFCITTSGNSQNILNAAITAKAKGLKVIGLTGKTGGKLKQYCDISICVPSTDTPDIQELHLPIYHTICAILEDYFY